MHDRLGRPEPDRVEERHPDRNVVPRQGWRGRGRGTTNIPEGIKKIDDHTVEITLEAPDATFLRRIAGAVYYIQPKHILDGLTGAEAETCEFCLGTAGVTIGSGPYDFETSISATGADFTGQGGLLEGQGRPGRPDRLQDPGVERLRRPAGRR